MNIATGLKAFRLRQSFERSRTSPPPGAAAGKGGHAGRHHRDRDDRVPALDPGIQLERTDVRGGAARRPTCTVSGDGLQGLANAYMQIQTGLVDVAVVEAHSKASDVVTLDGVIEHALDPIWNKPLGAHPFVVAGLEADAYLRATRTSPKALAAVVAKNRG